MCVSPITFRNHDTGEVVTVPCGKCIDCVVKYQNDWTFRLEQEYTQWSYSYFLTLTYDNKHLPYRKIRDFFEVEDLPIAEKRIEKIRDKIANLVSNRSLCYHRANPDIYNSYLRSHSITLDTLIPFVNKDDVQKWLKRVRRSYYYEHNENLNFKYFLCSEYGPNTFRPHYHIIIFCNLNLCDFQRSFVAKWHFGRVDWSKRHIIYQGKNGIGDVMSYVSKYCSKPVEFENPYVVSGLIPKPFRLVSKKMGACYQDSLYRKVYDSISQLPYYHRSKKYDEMYCSALDECFYTLRNGFRYRLPRYYIDKCFPQKYYESVRFNPKSHMCEIVYQKRKDAQCWLCRIYKAYRTEKFFKYLRDQYVALSPDDIVGENLEITLAVERQILQMAHEKLRNRYKSLYRFYARSWHLQDL